MAPSSPAGIIYQALIQSNCQTFLGSDVDVDVVSQLDAAGTTWKVHVLKTEGGKRTAVLSGSATSLLGAFEKLHRKSAQAVDQYVSSNGFDAVPPEPLSSSPRRRRSRKQRRGAGGRASSPSSSSCSQLRPGSPVSEQSRCTSPSSTEGDASASDSDDDGTIKTEPPDWEASVPLPLRSRTGKANRPPPFVYVAGPGYVGPHPPGRPVATGTSNWPVPGPHMLPQMAVPMPVPPLNGFGFLPLPPPGMARPPPIPGMPGFGKPTWNVNSSGGTSCMPRPPSMLAPGQQQPASLGGPSAHLSQPMPQLPPPGTALKGSVMLTINWKGHGEASFLDRCELSQAVIREKVVDILATRGEPFGGRQPWHFLRETLSKLHIEVERVKVGQRMCFVRGTMQDDLSVLLSMGPPPRVVQIFVDVDEGK